MAHSKDWKKHKSLQKQKSEDDDAFTECRSQYRPIFIEDEEKIDEVLRKHVHSTLRSSDDYTSSDSHNSVSHDGNIIPNEEESKKEKQFENDPVKIWLSHFPTPPNETTWSKASPALREKLLDCLRNSTLNPSGVGDFYRYGGDPQQKSRTVQPRNLQTTITQTPPPYDPHKMRKKQEEKGQASPSGAWNLAMTIDSPIHKSLPVDFTLSFLDTIEFNSLYTHLSGYVGSKVVLPNVFDSLINEMYPLGLHFLSDKRVEIPLSSAPPMRYSSEKKEVCLRLVAKFSIDPSFKTKKEERETRKKEREIRQMSKAIERERERQVGTRVPTQPLSKFAEMQSTASQFARERYEQEKLGYFGRVRLQIDEEKPKKDFSMRYDGTNTLDGLLDDVDSCESSDDDDSDIEEIVTTGISTDFWKQKIALDNFFSSKNLFTCRSDEFFDWFAAEEKTCRSVATSIACPDSKKTSASGFVPMPHHMYHSFSLIQDPAIQKTVQEAGILYSLGKPLYITRDIHVLQDKLEKGRARAILKSMHVFADHVRLPTKYTMTDESFRQFLNTRLRVLVFLKPTKIQNFAKTRSIDTYVFDHFLFYISGLL